MTDAIMIEHAERIAEISVRDGSGYRFYASHSLFRPLDTKRFRRITTIRTAVAKLIDGPPARVSPAPQIPRADRWR